MTKWTIDPPSHPIHSTVTCTSVDSRSGVQGFVPRHPSHLVATMPLDLSEIPVEELVHEVQRRLECLSKPEKRLILIGEACTCGPRHMVPW